MDWPHAPGADAGRVHFANNTIAWQVDFTRPDALKDVPFSLQYPTYLATSETIILPRGGEGFTIEGKDLVRDVDGAHIERHLSLAGGRAIARSSFRIDRRELAAKEAAASSAILAQVNADQA